jgi:phosphate transport system permease protein
MALDPQNKNELRSPDPERFTPSRRVIFIDRMMNRLISVGGMAIIAAVMGILAFIVWKVVPLFGEPSADLQTEKSLPENKYIEVGIDEWGELPFALSVDGSIRFLPIDEGAQATNAIESVLPEGRKITASVYRPLQKQLLLAMDNGSALPVLVDYEREFFVDEEGNDTSRVVPTVEVADVLDLQLDGGKIIAISFAESDKARIVAAIIRDGDDYDLKAFRFTRKKTLLGAGKFSLVDSYDLGGIIEGVPDKITVSGRGDMVVVANKAGEVFYLHHEGTVDGAFSLRQRFMPFEERPDRSIELMEFLIGDVSLAFSDGSGLNRNYSLYIPEGESQRLFGLTKEFAQLGESPAVLVPSLRNKSFLFVAGNIVSLRYATSNEVRWEQRLDFEPIDAALNQKHNRILLLDEAHKFHLYELRDPHPEAGWTAYFGKIWYEDSPGAAYTWQSTGGTDAFEPKLSLMPLIVGTLKGTLYAILFAVPIAILAAIYTSQFLTPRLKAIVKPTMEVMASLPSVVLGFMGALWLAPILEHRTCSLMLMVIFIPSISFLLGWWWSRMPIHVRRRIPQGREFFVFAPVLLILGVACWKLGPSVENIFFVVTDDNGVSAGSFKAWWFDVMGLRFEQRNCVIIGIMMGFAVIPIIFTITEDALSSVPESLRSGSLALGASRWQSAWRIVLPTASAGIFSAVMIGFGRAIGETMIVTMATGNTPIMEMNIFSGMRTLSANIATELPEAPENGTLYRTLFLGALVLFVMTFVLNTVAEVLRQHLRDKYKTV